MRRVVLHRECLPTRFPFLAVIVFWLVFDRLGVEGGYWAFPASLLFGVIIVYAQLRLSEEPVRIAPAEAQSAEDRNEEEKTC
jgi:4-hydroxybenzoate polyprenyltransferase